MANVKLSSAEIELMNNAAIILTKNKIIQSVYELFGSLSMQFQEVVFNNHFLLEAIKNQSPKISKGENYEGLPWVILDYPRLFNKNDVFAIRIFFWWGNFCSITLHTKGVYNNLIQPNLANCIQNKQGETLLNHSFKDWFLCCNTTTEWRHDFRIDNYLPIDSFTIEAIEKLDFIKLSKKIPLQEWDFFEAFLKQSFINLLQGLTTQAMK